MLSNCVDLTTGEYYLAAGSPREPNELVPFKAADVDLFVSVLDEVLSRAW
jgi:hypothetical protein